MRILFIQQNVQKPALEEEQNKPANKRRKLVFFITSHCIYIQDGLVFTQI